MMAPREFLILRACECIGEAGKSGLHQLPACFETRPLGAPQHEVCH
jgi:hypothetical protein